MEGSWYNDFSIQYMTGIAKLVSVNSIWKGVGGEIIGISIQYVENGVNFT